MATAEDLQEEPGGGSDSFVPHVNRIVGFCRKLKKSGRLQDSTPEQLFATLRDLTPALEVCSEIAQAIRESGDLTIGLELDSDLKRTLSKFFKYD